MADQDMFLNQMYSVMVSGEQSKIYTFACFDLPFVICITGLLIVMVGFVQNNNC